MDIKHQIKCFKGIKLLNRKIYLYNLEEEKSIFLIFKKLRDKKENEKEINTPMVITKIRKNKVIEQTRIKLSYEAGFASSYLLSDFLSTLKNDN